MIIVIDDLTFVQQNIMEFIIMNPRDNYYPHFEYDEKKEREKKEREKKRQEWLQSLSKKRKAGRRK